MPELPDVEGYRRFYDRHAPGRNVRSVRGDGSIVRNTTVQGIGRSLHGRRLERARRHGKWLLCGAGGPTLVLHFGMGGDLHWNEDEHPHDRLVLELDGGTLSYRNMRKFGGVWLARDERELDRLVGSLGPDWLDVSRSGLEELLERRRGSIKSALMDQRLAAGLGNLTADEALWQARIDPARPVPSLTREERSQLHRQIRKVLRDSLPYGLVPSKRTWLTGAREEGVCPRCGSELRRLTIGGRTTLSCPREQH